MSVKLRKTRKMRGGGGHGYGAKKKHRGKGSKGGKGYSGSHKHHYIRTMINEPDHFGKHGFTSLKKMKKTIKTVNVGDLEKLADKNEINLTLMGVDKLLGKGTISKPLTVLVATCSKQAKEKIEKAGGTVVVEEAPDKELDAAEGKEPAAEKAESEEEFEEAEDEAEEQDETEDEKE